MYGQALAAYQAAGPAATSLCAGVLDDMGSCLTMQGRQQEALGYLNQSLAARGGHDN